VLRCASRTPRSLPPPPLPHPTPTPSKRIRRTTTRRFDPGYLTSVITREPTMDGDPRNYTHLRQGVSPMRSVLHGRGHAVATRACPHSKPYAARLPGCDRLTCPVNRDRVATARITHTCDGGNRRRERSTAVRSSVRDPPHHSRDSTDKRHCTCQVRGPHNRRSRSPATPFYPPFRAQR
jgi:hypothetical protein